MASTGVMEGRLILLLVEGVVIAHAKSNTTTHTTAVIDVTTKDSANNATFLAGIRNSSAQTTFLFAEDATNGYEDLFDYWKAGTAVTLRETSGVVGDKYYESEALITNLSKAASNGDTVSCDVSFQISGEITKGTEA